MRSNIFNDVDAMQELVDVLPVSIFVKDAESKFLLINKACEDQWGMSFSDLRGTDAGQFFPPDQMELFLAKDREVFAGKCQVDFEESFWNETLKQNRIGHTFKKPIYDASGHPLYLICITTDITERKKTEVDLRIASVAFESQESMVITDANCVILKVNHAFTETTGYTAEEAVGQTPRLLKSGRHDAEFYRAMWETIRRTGSWQGEIWDRRKNGEEYPKWLIISAVMGDGGVVTHYVGAHLDIAERKATEEIIKHLAFYDHLTNLPNRRLLLDRLQQGLTSSARSGRKGALLFIDLDNFKTLNDTLGHDIGDLLLQQVAQRMESCVRESDTVARLGGDEFVVLLEDLSEQVLEATAQTETVGEKILAALNQPYQLAMHEYHSTPSIGATLFNGHHQTIEELLKQADSAMYQSKEAGRNTLRFFVPPTLTE